VFQDQFFRHQVGEGFPDGGHLALDSLLQYPPFDDPIQGVLHTGMAAQIGQYIAGNLSFLQASPP
jgi:hypothetical protein